jgi:fumarate hydratase class II
VTYRYLEDSMGTVRVPVDAYYGAQTQRAVENFPISGTRFAPALIHALALVKRAAAQVNADLGLLDGAVAGAIAAAAQEVLNGRWADQFVVDVFQTGSGTSTNMNMNEVLAARANEILTGRRDPKQPVHPNDHVNLGQSSNDVIPSMVHIAALGMLQRELLPALAGLHGALEAKAGAFADVAKIGRTHLQDAVPMTLGQVFSGFARQVALGQARLAGVTDRLAELALGGTAVGTGVNTHPEFAGRVITEIAAQTRLPLREAANHFEAQAARDAVVETSGALKTLAVSLTKIANDLRWLSSGPRCGIGEITLPALQPGSSIMPGKVNPVIPEVVLQVAAQVIGNDTAITIGGQAGNFELNVMMPVVAHNLLQSLQLLTSAVRVLAEKCVAGIQANRERAAGFIAQSLALATSLVPHIGYDAAAAVAKRAHASGRTVEAVVRAEGLLPEEQIDQIFRNPFTQGGNP